MSGSDREGIASREASEAVQPVRLGTRGSDLALAQARMVEAGLRASSPGREIDVRVIRTVGDKRPDLQLREFSAPRAVGGAEILDKGIFTRELEEALAAGEIDAAVHSLKDVPTELDDAFHIAATLPRAPIEDVLLVREKGGEGLDALAEGAVVATSSVRRARQLRWLRPDLEVIDIRGNVPTRIRKLTENEGWGGIMLARAGLERLGFLREGSRTLDFEGPVLHVEVLAAAEFLPAAGQGAVAIECHRDDTATNDVLASINDGRTLARVTLERGFLARLKAGCQTPVGAHTAFDEAGNLGIRVRVFDEDDDAAPPREAEASGPADQIEDTLDRLMDALYGS